VTFGYAEVAPSGTSISPCSKSGQDDTCRSGGGGGGFCVDARRASAGVVQQEFMLPADGDLTVDVWLGPSTDADADAQPDAGVAGG
jgi:hypothetical protein